jgi:hypothetical protein
MSTECEFSCIINDQTVVSAGSSVGLLLTITRHSHRLDFSVPLPDTGMGWATVPLQEAGTGWVPLFYYQTQE